MEVSRNKQFMRFKFCSVLRNGRKTGASGFHHAQDMSHFFLVVCPHFGCQLSTSLLVGLIHQLQWCCVHFHKFQYNRLLCLFFGLLAVNFLWCLICTLEFATASYIYRGNSVVLIEFGVLHSFRCWLEGLENMGCR